MGIHNQAVALLQYRWLRKLTAAGLTVAAMLLGTAPAPAQYGSGINNYSGGQNDNSGGFGNRSNFSSGSSNQSRSFKQSRSSSRYGSSSSSRSDRSGRDQSDQRAKDSRLRREKKNGDKSGQPGRARLSAKSTVVKRKATAGKKKATGAEAIALPAVKADPQRIESAAYFLPAFIQVAPRDQFATTLTFYNSNARENPVDEVKLWVRYDPRELEPLWVDTAPLKKQSDGPLTTKVWREQGYICLAGRLKTPLKGDINDLAGFYWKALKVSQNCRIELAAPAGETGGVLSKGKDLIEKNSLGNPLRASMAVTIAPAGEEEPGLRLASEVARNMTPPPLGSDQRLRLAIIARQATLGAGETATADVVLTNPSREAFDELKFRIRFDPSAVKILDADVDNYIKEGVNIFDGDFHKSFPFEYHGANRVNTEEGIIDYHVGRTMGPAVYPSGTVARIVYRMERSAGKAGFWFEQADPIAGTFVTDVSNRGRSLLGDSPATAAEALHGAEIAVRPLNLRKENWEFGMRNAEF